MNGLLDGLHVRNACRLDDGLIVIQLLRATAAGAAVRLYFFRQFPCQGEIDEGGITALGVLE